MRRNLMLPVFQMTDWISPDIYSGELSPRRLSFPMFEVAIVDTEVNPLPVFRHYFSDIELADSYRNSVPRPRYYTVDFMKLHKFGTWVDYRDSGEIHNIIMRIIHDTGERAYDKMTREVYERMKKLTEAYKCECPYHRERPVTSIRKTTFNRAFKEAYHCYNHQSCPKGYRCFYSTRIVYSFIRHLVRERIKTGELEPLSQPVDSLQRLCLDVVRGNGSLLDCVTKQFSNHCRLKQLVFMKIER